MKTVSFIHKLAPKAENKSFLTCVKKKRRRKKGTQQCQQDKMLINLD